MIEQLTFENGMKIEWVRGLDGGGPTQYTDFLNYLKVGKRKYTHCLEWCAGLGAIGYSILDAGICDQLSLLDLYEPAQEWAITNAHNNNITVNFYLTDTINKIPQGTKFDLVVANPPHCVDIKHILGASCASETDRDTITRLTLDQDWAIHKEFFSNISKYLVPGADIILSETDKHYDLISSAENNGLTFITAVPASALAEFSTIHAVLMHFKYEKEVY